MAKILVVDDQPTNIDLLVTLLGYQGHHLIGADNGAEALKLAQAERPNLIIADILMPTMDGYEFVRRLRTEPALADIPIMFYTAHYQEREARALAQACGVEHILMKPSEPEIVLRTVETLLNLPLPTVSPPPPELFNQEHMRLLTNKLSQKVEELQGVNEQLNRLIELNLHLALERDPARLLESFCQAAQNLVSAKYAVVSTLKSDGAGLELTFTSGLSQANDRPLLSSNLLDLLAMERGPFRRYNSDGDPEAVGFPPSFPAIHALLAAPILSPSRIYGWICLIDKGDAMEFSQEEEKLVGILAAQTGRIYENDQLYAELEYRLKQLEQEMSERRQAEEALRLSDERFSKAFQSSPDMLVISRLADGYILEVNSSWETLAGYSRDEVIGRTSIELNLFVNLLDRQQIIEQLREQGSMRDFELEIRSKSGEVLQTSLSAETIMVNNELCLLTTVRDITERKQAEEALRSSEERFRQVVVSVSDHIYMTEVSAGGVYKNRYLSPNVETLTGYSLDKFESDWSFWRSLIHPDDQPLVATQVANLDVGQSSEVEYRLTRADGAIIWVRDSARVERSDGADIIYGVVSDITIRKQADEKIRYQATLIENVSDAIFSTNLAFNILSWNRAAEEIYGWLADEVLGKPVSDVLHTEYLNGNRDSSAVQLFEQGSWQGEVIQKRKDGTTINILASISLIKDSVGQRIGVVAVIRNITERKKMEDRLRQQREQLRHLGTRIQNVTETEKRQLSRELHDQVGQSTTTLALDLTILESVLPAEAVEAREWLAHSLAEVKQMTSAIRGVMHELRPPELDDYGLTAALQWYGQQFEQRSGLPVIIKAVELTPRLPPDTETALFRITQEAMTNVLKHARAKRVTIILEQLAGGIRLTIADDGIGFVFSAADVARPSVQEGGWGLLTMRERSVAIGGNLTIASAPSQGTRIIIDIKR